jgi:serine/alanine adding enzyme
MTEEVGGYATELRVEPVDPTADPEWDARVQAWGGTFCHLAGWAPLLSGVLDAEPRYRVARDARGKVQGALPLFRVRSRIFGDYLVSVPFLNYGGPLGSDPGRAILVRDAAREAEAEGVDLLELRLRIPVAPVPEGLRRSDRKVTVVLDLPDDPKVLFEDVFRAKLRSQIRRPMKEEMEVRFGENQVEPFLRVFQRNMRDLGTPVLPAELFRRFPETFSEGVTFGVVYHGEKPVAAGCGFSFREEFEMTWASSLSEYNRLAPNMLLYWGFMERCIERGLATFNFGRCTPGGGTHRFKKQWESQDEPLPWLQWSPGDADATPSPESGRFGLAIRAWRRLPLPVANRLGPFLARRIP